MSNHLLVQLEVKIDDMIETLEILRLQVSDLEEKNNALHTENAALKARQFQWEQGLTTLLNKLEDGNSDPQAEINQAEAPEIEEAFV
jgi:FtsZ-binding cell division protein ZapB